MKTNKFSTILQKSSQWLMVRREQEHYLTLHLSISIINTLLFLIVPTVHNS